MDTLVIGLDGGEWEVIAPLIERGELPHLARIKAEGVSGPLQSITPPVSPPAWNSIQTGTNPGKHGIYDFSTFDEDYSRRSVNSADRSVEPFWTVMNDEGVKTGLFKVPFTYPPDDVDGFMVTGFPTPNIVDDHATPAPVADRVGPVEDLFEDWSLQQAGDYEAFLEDLIQVAERQTDLFLELLQDYETDFSMTVYDGSDRVQHFFWKYFDESHPRYTSDSPLTGAIEEYYRTVDRGIGRILDIINDDCDVIVISDHGFGPLSSDIYVDEWLVDEGFLSRRSELSGGKAVDDVLATTLKAGWRAVKHADLDTAVRSLLPASWFQRGKNLQDDSHRDIIWDETQVFFGTLSGQALFVNLEEGFNRGTVPQNQYDEVVSEVRRSLLSLQHPETGKELVEEVIRSDEAFDGWRVEQAPDLIVRTVPDHTLKGGRSDTLVQPSAQNDHDRSGDHRTNGIFLAAGPSFSSGSIEGASVLDIAPTLLYLQGSPIPQSIDGSVLTEALDNDLLDKREIRTTAQYGQSDNSGRQWSDDEEAELEKRLSDMGYLD
ncbi:alkaline phosphatase family protein [Halorubrum distributum]|uniref:Type I phosphodiesterase/nucleotide pyrophosphatase n=1 Tax=Halorubrum distributum JCM 13916 TaxID=1230455 RepID=M0PQD9_9EURY|nr:alkaline phosphatase family protein [Halorubrum arcis]EMA71060.1 type I phosphodiesterase/nucleotide pyrophosphatase [Halorubrum arcis JCM 13916]